MESSTAELALQLQAITVFSDLAPEDLTWLASRMELAHYQPGDVVAAEGSPADRLIVILEGELYGQREHEVGDSRVYITGTGRVTGMLPFSRLTHLPLTVRATRATTLALLHVSHFPEMLERLPALGPKLVGVMADRRGRDQA